MKNHASSDLPLGQLQAKAWAGDAAAQNELGERYFYGRSGVNMNHKEAVAWFRRAAEQGDAHAQLALGVMYEKGQGVPQNKIVAYALFSLSAGNDPSSESNASNNRKALADDLSAEEIEAAQTLTRRMQAQGVGAVLDEVARKSAAPPQGRELQHPLHQRRLLAHLRRRPQGALPCPAQIQSPVWAVRMGFGLLLAKKKSEVH